MTEFLLGVRILFVLLFAVTATTKIIRRTAFELALVKLLGVRPYRGLPWTSRTAAYAIAGYEYLLALLLATGWGHPVGAWLLVLTTVVFLGVVGRAWKMHVDCGCFPDRRPAEVASMLRSVLLVGLAVTLALGGLPLPDSPGGFLLGLGAAVLLGGAVHLAYLGTRSVFSRDSPPESHPPVIHRIMADQILAQHGREPVPATLPDDDGWLEAEAMCRATRFPVSTLMTALQENSRQLGPALLPLGTTLPALDGRLVNGEAFDWDRLAPALLVILFSATCKRCPLHVDEVSDHLAATGARPEEVLIIVAGDPSEPNLFTDTYAGRASVLVTPWSDDVLDTFAVRDFPVFYTVDESRTVVAAAHTIGDLATVSS